MGNDNLSLKAKEAIRHIRNTVINTGGMPSIRDLMRDMAYKSPRSVALLLVELDENGYLEKREDGSYRMIKDLDTETMARTISIPLIGTVACGLPILAEQNIEAYVPVTTTLVKSGAKYYLLRAKGDSMDKAGINDGDLILVRQQQHADEGQNIVALIDDEATVKEFRRKDHIIMLLPRSYNAKHQPIILTEDFQIQGIVVASIPSFNI